MDEEKQINDEHTGSTQNKNKKRNKTIIAIISILVVVVLIVGGYIWYKMSKMNRTELEPDAIEKNEAGEGRESLRGKGTQFRESGREDCVQK